MFYIYKITNNINKKVYIGLTCRDIHRRWIEHCSRARQENNNFYLHNAIKKYGENNFTIEILDKTTSIEELNQLEQKYIKLYHSNDKQYGYNLTLGGEGKKGFEWEEIRALWDKGYSVKEIAKIIGCYRGTVGQALKDYPNYNYSISLQRSSAKSKPIDQYNNQKQLINSYPSVAAAAKDNNCNEMTIRKCLKNQTYYAVGYYWIEKGKKLPDTVTKKQNTKKRKVNQYDLNDNFITTFSSAADAARAVHPNSNINSSSSSILQVCKGNRPTAYGYKWKYEE